jgi:hypothetical protein
MSAAPGWEGILDDGEKILWQGRPDGGFYFKPGNIATFVFGLFFAGFALFWMVMAASAGGGFWMFGLIHFAVGIGLSFGAIFWGTLRRNRTWYTLSDRRAFIATDLPFKGKELRSYPIERDTVLDYRQGRFSTIFFTDEVRRGNKGRRYTVPIGFERISEGEKVYRLMRDVQKGAA